MLSVLSNFPVDHDSCIVCTLCSKQLIGHSIYCDKDEKPFCVACFTKKEGKQCAKCKQQIAPAQTRRVCEEKNYHQV